MKKKFSKILGVGLTLVMVLALTAGFSLPVGASPDENEWSDFIADVFPIEGEDGGWFYDPTITGVIAIDQAVNGDLYAYLTGLDDLYISTDGGRSWAVTDYDADLEEIGIAERQRPIVDIACSSIDEEIVYVATALLVFKSDDAGDIWDTVADATFPTLDANETVTCLAVGYDANDDPFVFIGTADSDADPDFGGVWYIEEERYGAEWTDLRVGENVAGIVYDVYSIACSPTFADDSQTVAVVTDEVHTYATKNYGTAGDWPDEVELQEDDDTDFEITAASDICFPDDYEDTETLFVGVVGEVDSGDVYMVIEDEALDLDIFAATTDTDIIGLDILGETDVATLVAGASGSTTVFYSTDGGYDWDVTALDETGTKAPSGANTTLIVLTEDSVFAATSGAECALSLSVDGGVLFNQISLIATEIDQVLGVGFSNEYTEDETMFLLTQDTGTGIDSLFRYDGENWERVAERTVIGAALTINMVGISPDYAMDTTVFLGDTTTSEIFYTNDAGNQWDEMRYDPDFLTTWLIIDGDTLIVGGWDGVTGGDVQQTTRSGSRPWEDAEEVALAAGVIVSIVKSGDEILVGDDASQVFISPDGELDEFEEVSASDIAALVTAAGVTHVAFGSDILYAASDDVVARCVVDPDEDWVDQDWEEIVTPETTITQTIGADAFTITCTVPGVITITEPAAPRITVVVTAEAGVTATTIDYAANAWTITFGDVGDIVTVTTAHTLTGSAAGAVLSTAPAVGTIAVAADADGDALIPVGVVGPGGPPVNFVMPDLETTTEDVVTLGLQTAAGIVSAGTLYVVDSDAGVGMWRSLNPDEEDVEDVVFETVTAELDIAATLTLAGFTAGSYVVWATNAALDELWTYEDTLATEVLLNSPAPYLEIMPSVPDTDEATLEWFELTGADEYEIAVDTSGDFDGIDFSPDDTDELSVTIEGLEPGTIYYWKVRVAEGEPLLSRWSEVRSFITALETVAVPDIWVPEVGAEDVPLSPPFMWTGVAEATGYKIVIATDTTFAVANRIVETMVTTNAYACEVKLDYNTTYYWKVKAYSNGTTVSDWTSGMFTTKARPVAPVPTVEITPAPPAPELEVTVPPAIEVIVPAAQLISPTWIYVIIGVGAVLVIAVIVLIVRTRRVT